MDAKSASLRPPRLTLGWPHAVCGRKSFSVPMSQKNFRLRMAARHSYHNDVHKMMDLKCHSWIFLESYGRYITKNVIFQRVLDCFGVTTTSTTAETLISSIKPQKRRLSMFDSLSTSASLHSCWLNMVKLLSMSV